jgi:hypothetical protein
MIRQTAAKQGRADADAPFLLLRPFPAAAITAGENPVQIKEKLWQKN